MTLALNKQLAKQVLRMNKIPVPRGMLLSSPEFDWQGELSFPLIVKPAQEDASVGITPSSVVEDEWELRFQVERLFQQLRQPLLVEEYIHGREINIAVLGNEPPECLPLSEIDFSHMPPGYPHIVTYNAKWKKDSLEYQGTLPICPAEVEPDIAARLRQVALAAYEATGCRDYARVDIRVDAEGNIYVVEVNPNPDISPDAGLARAAQAAGLGYQQLILKLVRLAARRGMVSVGARAEGRGYPQGHTDAPVAARIQP
jgi:D-alanine-D-alanine ligase